MCFQSKTEKVNTNIELSISVLVYNISYKLLRLTQFVQKFLENLLGLLCTNSSTPSTLLNVAVYWESSKPEGCAKKLSQILANNIENGEKGIGLTSYMTYCRNDSEWGLLCHRNYANDLREALLFKQV